MPEALTEQDVTVGADGEWALPGTLTLPAGATAGEGSLLILVHGSGPNDRDETIDDTAAAAALAQELGYDEIYLLGHSLGGMLIPRIAAETPQAAGYVMLAAPSRDMLDLLEEQYHYIYSLEAPLSAEKQAELDELLATIERMRGVTVDSTYSAAQLMGMPVSYLLDLQGYDPAKAAQDIDKPLLILQGEADYQVTMADFAGFEQAVGARDNVTMIAYPGLNHLLMPASGEKSVPLDYQIAGCVDEQVLDDIAAFIQH